MVALDGLRPEAHDIMKDHRILSNNIRRSHVPASNVISRGERPKEEQFRQNFGQSLCDQIPLSTPAFPPPDFRGIRESP